MPGTIHSVRDGNVGWIIFDHPERRNAVSANMWSELAEVAAGFARDDEVRVVIMRGQGEEAFVSGADISQFQNESGSQTSSDLARNTADAFHVLSHGLDKPLIAMIQGFCMGGGLGTALHADIRIATSTSVFGVPAARLGLGYPYRNMKRIVDLIGPSRTKEVFFTARQY
ncbi:enoyl-CoA hydratase-related protein, partial [Myxococcota bacterium]|nr:enoyl-CoA hydratase-related protein [Myxococcota bacterium]